MSNKPYRNVEGYPDPTAGKAINRITAEEYNAKLEANMSEAEHQTRLFSELAKLTKEIPELTLLKSDRRTIEGDGRKAWGTRYASAGCAARSTWAVRGA